MSMGVLTSKLYKNNIKLYITWSVPKRILALSACSIKSIIEIWDLFSILPY